MLHEEVAAGGGRLGELLQDPVPVVGMDILDEGPVRPRERSGLEAVRRLHLGRPRHPAADDVPAPGAHAPRREREAGLELTAAQLLLDLASGERRAEQVRHAAGERDVVLVERPRFRGVRTEDAEGASGQPDDRAHRADDRVRPQARAALEPRLGAQVRADHRAVGLEREARERGAIGADPRVAEEHRIPSGAGLDVEPGAVVAQPHRGGQRDAETVGQQLDRDVEQLLLVVDLEREATEVRDDPLLALAQAELLERDAGLVDLDAQARVAEEGAVTRVPGDAVVQHPPELTVGPAQPVLHREGLLALERLRRDLEAALDVVRVHRGDPAVTHLLGHGAAREAQPLVVAPRVATVRTGSPEQQRDAVRDGLETRVRERGRSRRHRSAPCRSPIWLTIEAPYPDPVRPKRFRTDFSASRPQSRAGARASAGSAGRPASGSTRPPPRSHSGSSRRRTATG